MKRWRNQLEQETKLAQSVILIQRTRFISGNAGTRDQLKHANKSKKEGSLEAVQTSKSKKKKVLYL